MAFALELNALWLGSPDVREDTEAGTSLNTENAQVRTGEEESPVAERGFPSAVVSNGSEAQADQACNAPNVGRSKGAPGNRSIECTPNNSPIAFVSRDATSAGSFISGQNPAIQHAESQVTADWTGHDFDQPEAELSLASTTLPSPSAQSQVLVNEDPDSTSTKPRSAAPPSAGKSSNPLAVGAPGTFGTVVTQSENLLGQAQPTDSAGPRRNEPQNQDVGGNVAFNPLPFSTELTSRGADLSRNIAIPHADLSSVTQFRSPANDKGADSDRAGTSRDNNEDPSGSSNIAPATSVWTQAVSNTNSASDSSPQGSQQGYVPDRTATPAPSKSLPFASVVQKASTAGSDTSSETAVDPRQGTRWDSDAQNGPAPSSADSSTSHAPTLPNGDSSMVHSVQNVNSARLAETTGQSEIQVNLKSDSWGPVSVHATLSNGQVGAEIQVSDRDAHAALTEALHTLEKNLGENGIQVSNLNVSHGLGYSHAQSQNQQEKQAGQSTYVARSYTHRSAVNDDAPVASKGANTVEDFVIGRVSVRA